jgi:hypothetical protein
VPDALVDVIDDWLRRQPASSIRMSDLLAALDVPAAQYDRMARDAARALRSLGWEPRLVRAGTGRRVWVRAESESTPTAYAGDF